MVDLMGCVVFRLCPFFLFSVLFPAECFSVSPSPPLRRKLEPFRLPVCLSRCDVKSGRRRISPTSSAMKRGFEASLSSFLALRVEPYCSSIAWDADRRPSRESLERFFRPRTILFF